MSKSDEDFGDFRPKNVRPSDVLALFLPLQRRLVIVGRGPPVDVLPSPPHPKTEPFPTKKVFSPLRGGFSSSHLCVCGTMELGRERTVFLVGSSHGEKEEGKLKRRKEREGWPLGLITAGKEARACQKLFSSLPLSHIPDLSCSNQCRAPAAEDVDREKKEKKGPSHSSTNFLVPIDPSPVDIRGGRGGRSRRGGGENSDCRPPKRYRNPISPLFRRK